MSSYTYDVFIAYHGTYDDGGSCKKAAELHDFLTKNGVSCFFFPAASNPAFVDTPIQAEKCAKYLLVANETLSVNDNGAIDGSRHNGVAKEISAFYRCMFDNERSHGDARVYCFGALTAARANSFHTMFRGVAHFDENRQSGDRCFAEVLQWLREGTPAAVSRPAAASGKMPTLEELRQSIYAQCEGKLSRHVRAAHARPDAWAEFAQNYAAFFGEFTELKSEKALSSFSFADIAGCIFESAQSGGRELLLVRGPLGTGKETFLQTLYLYLLDGSIAGGDTMPCYISINALRDAVYECDGSESVRRLIEVKTAALFDGLETAGRLFGRKPLFIISDLCETAFSEESIDLYLKSIIQRRFPDYYLIIGVNGSLTHTNERLRNRLAFPSNGYLLEMDVNSVPTSQTERCERIAALYEKLCGSGARSIMSACLGLRIRALDLFTLDMINDGRGESSSLVRLLDGYCEEHLFDGDNRKRPRAAEIAFVFSYSGASTLDLEKDSDLRCYKLFRHEIIVHYLVACHYVNRLRAFSPDNTDISFFEQILPRESTRFIVPIINEDAVLEQKILDFTGRRYNDMLHLCKSEMHYFLGRLKNTRLRAEAIELLKKHLKTQTEEVQKLSQLGGNEKKIALFLYRSVVISLIYCGDGRVAEDYISRLISSKDDNNVNRGFHLEYYGDKPFMPTLDTLDFDDRPSVGRNTIRELLSTFKSIESDRSFPPYCQVSLFTLCSLIQARLGNPAFPGDELSEYMRRCIDIVSTCMEKHFIPSTGKIHSYYEMVLHDFRDYAAQYEQGAEIGGMLCTMLSSVDSLTKIKRAGWVKYSIEDAESISEHMYSCWLTGMLFLPEQYEDEPAYDKNAILNILLFHDWAESITGDIQLPKKTQTDYNYEAQLMELMLLRGTYPDVANLNRLYDLWEGFSYETNARAFNTRIAKDIDCIQALYRFCGYYISQPGKFSADTPREWFNIYCNKLDTPLGKQLYKKIILGNSGFAPVLELIPDGLRA